MSKQDKKITIIGLGGTNGSGKDTIAELLAEEYGFLNVSATGLLAAELDARGMSHERKNKSALSAEWRREHGMGVIVDKAHAEYRESDAKGMIVGSLRHPGETDKIHELGGVQIWVDADPEVRYERITSNDRGRAAEDNKTFDEFMADEQREMHPEGDAATLSLSDVKKRADIFIENNGNDIETFKKQVRTLLSDRINPLL